MRSLLAFLAVLAFLLVPAPAARAAPAGATGLVDGKGEPLPLRSTRVWIRIDAGSARATVRQVYENPHREPIEVVYVFPLPERAAVSDFEMKVGPRRIRGEVLRREAAERRYETAKSEGKTAAILSSERPNVFTQRVANVLPGEAIEISIGYEEELRFSDGRYHLAFPTVVGPRYLSAGDVADVPSKPGEFLPEGVRPGHELDLAVEIGTAVPVLDVSSESHGIVVDRPEGDGPVSVSLAPGDRLPAKDFLLSYRVAGDEPRAALIAHRTERGGFFALSVVPDLEPDPGAIAPREVVLVLDASGSMSGMPIETAKRTILRTLDRLGPRDTFRVMRFSDSASAFSDEPLPATPGNLSRVRRWVRGVSGSGGTEMLSGIRLSLAGPRDPERIRIVHFLTDGYIGNEARIFREIEDAGAGARVFPLGVGSSVNRHLIDGMAEVGRGAAAYIRHDAPERRIAEEVERFVSRVRHPALTDVEIDWGGLPVADLVPPAPRDVFGGLPLVLYGRYTGGGEGEIVITGRRGSEPFRRAIRVVLPAREEGHAFLMRRWARERIRRLELFGRRLADEEEAARLALDFGLLSRHTAFLAIDERVVVTDGEARTIRQPAPLPEGVSREGVFGRVSTHSSPFFFGGPSGASGHGGSYRGPAGEVPPGARQPADPPPPDRQPEPSALERLVAAESPPVEDEALRLALVALARVRANEPDDEVRAAFAAVPAEIAGPAAAVVALAGAEAGDAGYEAGPAPAGAAPEGSAAATLLAALAGTHEVPAVDALPEGPLDLWLLTEAMLRVGGDRWEAFCEEARKRVEELDPETEAGRLIVEIVLAKVS